MQPSATPPTPTATPIAPPAAKQVSADPMSQSEQRFVRALATAPALVALWRLALRPGAEELVVKRYTRSDGTVIDRACRRDDHDAQVAEAHWASDFFAREGAGARSLTFGTFIHRGDISRATARGEYEALQLYVHRHLDQHGFPRCNPWFGRFIKHMPLNDLVPLLKLSPYPEVPAS